MKRGILNKRGDEAELAPYLIIAIDREKNENPYFTDGFNIKKDSGGNDEQINFL